MEFIKENNILVFSILGLITFALSVYLGTLIVKVKNFKDAQKLKAEIRERNLAKREHFLKDSITTICRATLRGDCELSEACLRIKKLLENYPAIENEAEFRPIQDMYDEIKEFPYLEARQALTKQERFKQDNKRFKIEENYKEKMNKSLNLLLQRFENLS